VLSETGELASDSTGSQQDIGHPRHSAGKINLPHEEAFHLFRSERIEGVSHRILNSPENIGAVGTERLTGTRNEQSEPLSAPEQIESQTVSRDPEGLKTVDQGFSAGRNVHEVERGRKENAVARYEFPRYRPEIVINHAYTVPFAPSAPGTGRNAQIVGAHFPHPRPARFKPLYHPVEEEFSIPRPARARGKRENLHAFLPMYYQTMIRAIG